MKENIRIPSADLILGLLPINLQLQPMKVEISSYSESNCLNDWRKIQDCKIKQSNPALLQFS
jgi:hypothetical protein